MKATFVTLVVAAIAWGCGSSDDTHAGADDAAVDGPGADVAGDSDAVSPEQDVVETVDDGGAETAAEVVVDTIDADGRVDAVADGIVDAVADADAAVDVDADADADAAVDADLVPDSDPPDPGDGSWEAPFWFEVGATLTGDTAASAVAVADSYSPCAPGTSEAGPEVVYTFVAPADGVFVASVDDVPGDGVDVDLHLLTALDPTACVARDNVVVNHVVAAGVQYYLVVDTWFNGTSALSGPYVVTTGLSTFTGTCPDDMVDIGVACMDRYEAPNQPGALPLVMYHFYEAEDWCEARGKRLCFDDEWQLACEGPAKTTYPYGDAHQPGVCHDDATWLSYDQPLLSAWPSSASSPAIETLAELLVAASAVSPSAAASADHVEWLYQGAGGGDHPGCGGAFGVYDLVGNVEEWTRRADGGDGPDFSGTLKGRYWAEPRTCQQGVKSHGNAFRFYEIGFRCCLDPTP